MKLYRTIVADPPWPYGGHLGPSKAHRPRSYNSPLAGVNSVKRYGKMEIDELCGLQVPSDENAHLYLWTTNRFMEEAHRIARAWGFRPITIITWGKVKPDGTPSMKTGQYFRGATEHVVFAVRGSLVVKSKIEPTLFLSPRLPHSQKPAWFYELVERQSPTPYLELFARPINPMFPKMAGWDTWGNEVECDLKLEGAVA